MRTTPAIAVALCPFTTLMVVSAFAIGFFRESPAARSYYYGLDDVWFDGEPIPC